MSKITQAIHQVMEKAAYVQRTGQNAFFKYRYASEADILEVLRPAMMEAGLILIPSVTQVSEIDQHGNTYVTVEYTLAHKDGDIWPEKIVARGAGNDKSKVGIGDKGIYKALTGANKYFLMKLFQLATGDDAERDRHDERDEREPQPQRPAPRPVVAAEVEKKEYAAMLKELHACVTLAELEVFKRKPENTKMYHGWSEKGQQDFVAEMRERAQTIRDHAREFAGISDEE